MSLETLLSAQSDASHDEIVQMSQHIASHQQQFATELAESNLRSIYLHRIMVTFQNF
jgi:hypothetical protein